VEVKNTVTLEGHPQGKPREASRAEGWWMLTCPYTLSPSTKKVVQTGEGYRLHSRVLQGFSIAQKPGPQVPELKVFFFPH
jgi:hypothetical protein